MSLTRFVFKSHKWLAVATGAFAFLWFFSGVFMTTPPRLKSMLGGGGNSAAQQPLSYRDAKVAISEAITQVDRAAGQQVSVTNVEFRNIEGLLYYRIATPQNVYLVSGKDGSFLTIDAEAARRIVISKGVNPESIGAIRMLRTLDQEHTWGPLPAWRIEMNDAQKTLFYVEVFGGETYSTQRWGRILNFLTGLHTLDFLNPYVRRSRIRLLMWVFSTVGTIMVLFGFWILGIQFQNWRQQRLT